MSKHFSCKDCCKYQTDACDNPKYAESGKHLCPMYVLDIEECYQKGRADTIEECLQILHNAFAYDDYCGGCDDAIECDGCFYAHVKAELNKLKEKEND